MVSPGMRQGHPRAGQVAALALLLVLSAGASPAHHGLVNFDLNQEIEVSGIVTQIAFINPHSWLYLDVPDADGRVVAWKCELRGAGVLRRSGWTPEMFSPGTRITITGAPDRFEPNTCYLGTVLFADATRIDRYGQIQQAPERRVERALRRPGGEPNLEGDWAAEQRVLTDPRGMSGAFLPMSVAAQVDAGAVPPGGQAFPGTRGTEVSLAEDPVGAYWNRASAMPLTEAGARAIEGFDGASSDNPRLRCEPTNILFDWAFEADINRIVQHDDRIALQYGSMGLERTIHLGLTGHPPGIEPSRAGHSIGWWEGDVLVVDTVGFLPGILSADGRVPHSDRLHVVERFEREPDSGGLRRRYIALDPLYFEGEFAGADIVYPSDLPFQQAPCDDRSFRSDAVVPGLTGPMRALWAWAAAGTIVLVALWLTLRRRHAGLAPS
jgi:hypothetical protein